LVNYPKIVLATSNAGKINELAALLQPLQIEVIPQSHFNISDADETGLTYIENAIIKARHAAKLSGLPALADDSGLSVAGLNGRPGIYSARYAGARAASPDNIAKLLAELRDVPDDQRQATFHCVLAFLKSADDPSPLICHGRWHGKILREVSGTGGFGYDPVFYVPTENKSAAELGAELKNQISHRGMALRSFVTLLTDQS
jgi:XTP/dITP diphosphohydrolase